jgi:predicted DNA-binding transcriptional regulator AlpA
MDGLTSHLTTKQLATRWGMSAQTLHNWRHFGKGPKFLKLGRKVVYAIAEVEAFEASTQHTANHVLAR